MKSLAALTLAINAPALNALSIALISHGLTLIPFLFVFHHKLLLLLVLGVAALAGGNLLAGALGVDVLLFALFPTSSTCSTSPPSSSSTTPTRRGTGRGAPARPNPKRRAVRERHHSLNACQALPLFPSPTRTPARG